MCSEWWRTFFRWRSSLWEKNRAPFHLSGSWRPLLFRLVEAEGRREGMGDCDGWGWIVLLQGICAESNSAFIITICVDPGDVRPLEAEHCAMHGFLFPSHKTKLNFDSTQRVKDMSAKLGQDIYFVPWKSCANNDPWEVPTGLIKTKTFFFPSQSENQDLL